MSAGGAHQSSSASIPSSSGFNPLHTAHMELLHKQQTLKEPCEIPFVTLTEEDEKKLFDLSVQLKFGDFRTVMLRSGCASGVRLHCHREFDSLSPLFC